MGDFVLVLANILPKIGTHFIKEATLFVVVATKLGTQN